MKEREIKKLKRISEKSIKTDEVSKAIILGMCYGLRRGEVLGIEPKTDYDERTHILHIQRSVTYISGTEQITDCKTAKSNRYIVISQKHKELMSTTETRLINLTSTQLDKQFKQYLKYNKITPIRYHDLRHTYATWMYNSGVDAKIISDVLGHSNVTVTLDIYSHPDITVQKRCLDIINK